MEKEGEWGGVWQGEESSGGELCRVEQIEGNAGILRHFTTYNISSKICSATESELNIIKYRHLQEPISQKAQVFFFFYFN